MQSMQRLIPPIAPLQMNPATSSGLAQAGVLLIGLGNIGSFLAVMLAPLVGFLRLVDHGVVEEHNMLNQFYGPHHAGRTKVDVTAERLKQLVPHLQVQRRVADVHDLPWGDFADIDVGFSCLDSLGSRQVVARMLYTLGIPNIDGAVGEPMLSRTQVLIPGEACQECLWGPAQYRQLATEYPCRPGASPEAPRTTAIGPAGAATAAQMAAHGARLMSDEPPQRSFETNGDLSTGRTLASRRRRNDRCRFSHEIVTHLIRLDQPFAEATIEALLAAVIRNFDRQTVRLEFRRGILDADLFGPSRITSPEQLARFRHCTLGAFGLTPRDRVVVRTCGQSRMAHICFDASYGSRS